MVFHRLKASTCENRRQRLVESPDVDEGNSEHLLIKSCLSSLSPPTSPWSEILFVSILTPSNLRPGRSFQLSTWGWGVLETFQWGLNFLCMGIFVNNHRIFYAILLFMKFQSGSKSLFAIPPPNDVLFSETLLIKR